MNVNCLRLLAIVASLLLADCKGKKEPEIIKFEIANDGGDMPFKGKVLAIDNSLNCQFYGDVNSGKSGFFEGEIDSKLWDNIEKKLLTIDYKPLDESLADASNFEAVVYLKNGNRYHIHRHIGVKSTNGAEILSQILDTYKQIKLIPVKRKIKFETTYQNPPPVPPMTRSFLPPKI
ncbi:hypothetical protein AAFN85_07070 [Mucilaginibacter sp. CAU 1740]|uniref:hypothetical protein n=1 Tax=Mucilaginibacter sp. CAU 1740 TaxID=3140365 RepID=UPI00325BAFC3